MSEKWTGAPSHMLRARETRERIRAAFPEGEQTPEREPTEQDVRVDLARLMRAALDSGDWDRVQRVAFAIRTHEEAEAIACSAAAQLAGLKMETT